MDPMTPNFQNRDACVALVIEGTLGIGHAIAQELARDHRVIATCRSEQEAGKRRCDQAGAEIVQCDLALREDRLALIAGLRARYARIHLLVNTTGNPPEERRDIVDITEESFDELVARNLKGPHFLCQAVARWMLEQGGGRIIFVTQRGGLTDSSISNAGLSMSCKLYGYRLEAEGVRVFEIRCGAAGMGDVPDAALADAANLVRAIADGQLDFLSGQALDLKGGVAPPL
jgi:3-oxoacyl-[acyl-carrier protein] reductase